MLRVSMIVTDLQSMCLHCSTFYWCWLFVCVGHINFCFSFEQLLRWSIDISWVLSFADISVKSPSADRWNSDERWFQSRSDFLMSYGCIVRESVVVTSCFSNLKTSTHWSLFTDLLFCYLINNRGAFEL